MPETENKRSLKNKVVAGVGAVGIAAASAVGVNGACIDDEGLTMFPSERVVIQKSLRCYKSDLEYKRFWGEKVVAYKLAAEDGEKSFLKYQRSLEARELEDLIKHEITKLGGKVQLEPPHDFDNPLTIIDRIINKLNDV